MTTTSNDAMPVATVKRLNWIRTKKPTSAWATMNIVACETVSCPDGIGRERVCSTSPLKYTSTMALYASNKIAVDQVIPRAAGAAHGKRADEEQQDMPQARETVVVHSRETDRPPARHQKQP